LKSGTEASAKEVCRQKAEKGLKLTSKKGKRLNQKQFFLVFPFNSEVSYETTRTLPQVPGGGGVDKTPLFSKTLLS